MPGAGSQPGRSVLVGTSFAVGFTRLGGRGYEDRFRPVRGWDCPDDPVCRRRWPGQRRRLRAASRRGRGRPSTGRPDAADERRAFGHERRGHRAPAWRASSSRRGRPGRSRYRARGCRCTSAISATRALARKQIPNATGCAVVSAASIRRQRHAGRGVGCSGDSGRGRSRTPFAFRLPRRRSRASRSAGARDRLLEIDRDRRPLVRLRSGADGEARLHAESGANHVGPRARR